MALTWRSKRQLSYLLALVLGLALVIAFAIVVSRPEPGCFDQKKNQGEEGIDCGGPCEAACPEKAFMPVVLWTRVFKTAGNLYDAAASVENPNLLFGSKEIIYRFRLYDQDNILVAIREGKTFLNPGDKFLVFEPNLNTKERVPKRAVLEFDRPAWLRVEKERPALRAIKKDFSNFPFARLSVEIENGSVLDEEDIFVSAVLFDDKENAVAASQTKIDFIKAEGKAVASFTWPISFEPPPASSQIFIRTRIVP